MKDGCPGPPPAAAGNGGMRQQLMSLRAGLHPVTGLRLPASCGSTAYGSGTYSRLKPEASCDSGFVPYVPLTDEPLMPSGASAERKRWLMRGRLLCRIGKEAADLRRLRRKNAKREVRELIRSFVGDTVDDGQHSGDGFIAGSGSSVVGVIGLCCEQVVPAAMDAIPTKSFGLAYQSLIAALSTYGAFLRSLIAVSLEKV